MNEYVNKVINLAFCTVPLTEEDKAYIVCGYNDKNKQELVEVATKKKVLSVVGKMMISLQVDIDFWKDKYSFFKDRNIKIIELISEIFQKFAESGIDKICAFENFGAMLAAGTDIALYSSGDVDLYADVSFKQQIIDTLKRFDYYPANDDMDNMNIMTEFIKDNGIIRINVAWKPLRRFALPFKTDFAEHFDWDKTFFYKDTYIRLPEKNYLMYLCFLRIAVHGYSRSPDIRLYIDAYNSTYNDVDWNLVEAWAIRDKVETKFYTPAVIANDLIRLNVPLKIIENAKKNKYVLKILKICYDFENHTLKYDPSGMKLLKMEAASDNKSLVGELFSMLFPPIKWVKDFYCFPNENVAKGLIRYYKHFM